MNVLLLTALAVLSISACLVTFSPVSATTTMAPSTALPRIVKSTNGPVVVKAPFERKEGLRMSYARQGRNEEFQALVASQKQNLKPASSADPGGDDLLQRAERSVVVTSPLNDYWEGYWYGTVGVGNPVQYFTVLFDTGSANFWVMDSSCYSGCSGHVLYYSNKSTNYQKNGTPYNITYASGFANGFQGVDEFVLQGGNGSISLAMLGMPFGQTNDASPGNTAISGVLGLGFQSIAVNNMLPPVMYAISVGAFQQGLFTAYLASDYADGLAGGQITFGGLDTTNCGPVLGYAPLTAESYWQFSLGQVSVGSTFYGTNSSVVVSDTGCSTIAGPNATVAQIASAVGATWNNSAGAYVIGCSKQYTPVTFVINNISYQVTYKALTIGYNPSGSGQCLFGIVPSGVGMGIQWILGDPFIRQFCTIYDVTNKRIGFAKANGM